MLSKFYQKHSLKLLGLAVLTFPLLLIEARSLPSNNDIETWLPRESEVRSNYLEFKRDFGVEELIVVGLENSSKDDALVEAIAARLEQLPTVRTCWSPSRLEAVMTDFGVSQEQAVERLRGLALSQDGSLVGLICLLSEEGFADRAQAVKEVQGVLDYCQLGEEEARLAGAPVIVTELDRLGSEENNRKFFYTTLVICLTLLCYTTRHWALSLSLLGLTVWAINLTLAVIHWAGGEMNFILGALPVMVMVFTLAVAIHFIHYYQAASGNDDPLGDAFKLAWKPCCLATLTTTIGLISLAVSDIRPVNQFGYAAAWGSVAAMLTGLGLTPALMTIWPLKRDVHLRANSTFTRLGDWIVLHSKPVSLITVLLVMASCVGIFHLQTKIDPLDFLPQNSKILTDTRRIEEKLTNLDSVEAIVEFNDPAMPFTERLEQIRQIESVIARHPAVRHTMSIASFFPEELPQNPFVLGRLLKKAQARQDANEYIADGERQCRISARISIANGQSQQEIFEDLEKAAAHLPVRFTGIAPMLDQAQKEIFSGFSESFLLAFVIITLVMVVSLRSLKTALVAMIPNLTPICIVFGLLGWIGMPVDIGMMMSGSIALGIAVDGTFHFLICYQTLYDRGMPSVLASRTALLSTGAPIFKAALISSLGMLALTLSSFTPTARFGYLMCALLIAALIGDLVLLPSLLSLRPRKSRKNRTPSVPMAGPHLVKKPAEVDIVTDRVA